MSMARPVSLFSLTSLDFIGNYSNEWQCCEIALDNSDVHILLNISWGLVHKETYKYVRQTLTSSE